MGKRIGTGPVPQASVYETLTLLALNVCGIKNRPNYGEFVDFISNHEIIGLTETKTNNSDITCIHIPGFVTCIKKRCKLKNFRSGVGELS